MTAEDLTQNLKRLRALAGNPSVRDLAKLTERQGPGRAMSRSTVQDKISGKNPPRLAQVLAIVQACADYAKSIGAPLATAETDEQIWRERTQAALARTSSPPPVSTDIPANRPVKQVTEWDLNPLIRAGMYDMVQLVQASEGRPMAEWLPSLIHALDLAGMSKQQFLIAASMEQPKDLVESIMALINNSEALDMLMHLCARYQPSDSIPAIMVLLRRKTAAGSAELADRLIDLISEERSGPFWDAAEAEDNCIPVVLALRSATLEKDVIRLLKGIGAHGSPDYILEVVASFPDNAWGDREKVLSSVAEGTDYHISSVLKELRETKLDGIDPKKTLDRVIFGIRSRRQDIVSYLESQGLDEEARRVIELEDEPPF